jgi:hypothetical protein
MRKGGAALAAALLAAAVPAAAQVVEVRVKAGGRAYAHTQPVYADKAPVMDGSFAEAGGPGSLKARFSAVLDRGVDLKYTLALEDDKGMRLSQTSTVALAVGAAVRVAKCGPFEVELLLKEPAPGKAAKPTANARVTAEIASEGSRARCSYTGGSVHRLQADADVYVGERRRLLRVDAFPSDITREKSTLSGFFEVSGGGLTRLTQLVKPRLFPVDKKELILEGAGTKLYLRRESKLEAGADIKFEK